MTTVCTQRKQELIQLLETLAALRAKHGHEEVASVEFSDETSLEFLDNSIAEVKGLISNINI